MYTKVNRSECIACGICQLKAPKLFDYDDNGIAYCKLDHNMGTQKIPDALLEQLKTAYTHCPTHAIKQQAQPFKNKNN